MNCKKGDLAWIVVPEGQKHTPWGKALHMRVVTCEALWCHPQNGAPMWTISPEITFDCTRHGKWKHQHTVHGVADRVLRPVNGPPLPGTVEGEPLGKPIVENEDLLFV